jgi:tetratricopeptide (TPR) repeat protein
VVSTLKAQVKYSEFINEQDDVRKAYLAIRLYDRYIREDIDSIKVVGVNLLASSKEGKEHRFLGAVGSRLIGGFEIRRGNVQNGLRKLRFAAKYFEERETYDMASELYNDIGHGYYLIGEYDEAIIAYRKSIRLGKLGTDETSLYNGELGLGKAYVAKGDTVRGLEFVAHYKEEAIGDRKFEAAADAYGYMGMIAEEQHNIDLSNEYLLKSYRMGVQSESMIHKSHAITNRAIVFVNQGKVDSAEIYFIKARRIREDLANPKPLIESYYNLGSFYSIIEDFEASRKNFLLSADLAKEMGYLTEEIDALNALTEYDLAINDSWVPSRVAQLQTDLQRREGIDEEILTFLLKESNSTEIDQSVSGNIWALLLTLLFIGVFLTLFSRYST